MRVFLMFFLYINMNMMKKSVKITKTQKIKPLSLVKQDNKIAIGTLDTKRLKPVQIKEVNNDVQNNNPLINLALCTRPIYDKEFGCAALPNKASCMTSKLNDVLSCILTGKINDSYALFQTDRTHINCQKDDGYKFEEVKKLRGCINSNGFVTNNICTTEGDFCDCHGTGIDLNGNPTYKPYKVWSEKDYKCICDQNSSKPNLSEDGKCCTDKLCSNNDSNSYYNCLSETCECKDGYQKVSSSGNPEDGKCVRPCSSLSQNGLFNLITEGGYGCRSSHDILKEYGNYRLGGLTDLCCNSSNNQCVLDTSVQKTNTINSNDKVWMVEKNSISCPRNGSAKKLVCDLDLGGMPPVQGINYNSECKIENESIYGFDGTYCKEGSCNDTCNIICGNAGLTCDESHCNPGEIVPYQNNKLKYGSCSFKCKL